MNFLKKLFKKNSNITSENIIYTFADTLADSEDKFILTESMLEHTKKDIENAFENQILKQESFLKSSGVGGKIEIEVQKRLKETKALKEHLYSFVKVPPQLKGKIDEANKLYKVKLKEFGNKNDAFKNMPNWAQKLYVLATSNQLDQIGENQII